MNALEERLVMQNAEIKIQNQKIEEQSKALKELVATKDRFFSIIAHDLKYPFGLIVGFSDMLVNTPIEDNNKKRLFAVQINKAARDLMSLLENLLMWSRSQSGALKMNPIQFNLSIIISDILSLYSISAKEKNINLQKDLAVNQAFGDVNMIMTIIRNLVSNALKFTPEGGTILIKTEKEDDKIAITVKDSGVGMTQEQINKLFRIDVNTSTIGTNNERGTGLGLILVQEFVKLNGGTIKVKSEPNIGSEFIVSIPF